MKDKIKAKIMERFQLRAEQIVPDPEIQKSDDIRASLCGGQRISIIEPNQNYYNSHIDINLNQTNWLLKVS